MTKPEGSYKRYIVVRGSYSGTPDDRSDRWYIDDNESTTVDHRGAGYATRQEALEAANKRNREG